MQSRSIVGIGLSACLLAGCGPDEPTPPPRTRDEAGALAMEQFLYAPDIVYQGAESLLGLASPLVSGTAWFFW